MPVRPYLGILRLLQLHFAAVNQPPPQDASLCLVRYEEAAVGWPNVLPMRFVSFVSVVSLVSPVSVVSMPEPMHNKGRGYG